MPHMKHHVNIWDMTFHKVHQHIYNLVKCHITYWDNDWTLSNVIRNHKRKNEKSLIINYGIRRIEYELAVVSD